MNILRWRGKFSGAMPLAGLMAIAMAMALSCGGAAEFAADETAETQAASAPAPAAAATVAPASAMTDDHAGASGADPAGVEVEIEPAAVVQSAAAAPTPAPAASSATNGPGAAPPAPAQQSGRQRIVEARLTLEVERIDPAARQVADAATQRGGWVESTQLFGEGGYRSATVAIRAPAERLDETMDALRALGRTLDESSSATDVTDRLIDNAARLKAWRTQEERLITLLENATTVEDIIEVEKRIAEVRADIEQVAATQRSLANRVAASLITVHLQLPGRFAADPPNGSLSLSAADPDSIADAIATQVAGMNGYIGQRSEYRQGRSRVIELAAYVPSGDLAALMDYAGGLGEVRDRQFHSIGTPPADAAPNARLSITVSANVEVGASLQLETADPVAAAAAIRAQAESGGGFTESYRESMEDDALQVRMELAVKPAELRGLLDYAATLGEPTYSELTIAGQQSAAATPNARLTVSVAPPTGFPWLLFAGILAGSVALSLAITAGVVWLLSARSRAYARRIGLTAGDDGADA